MSQMSSTVNYQAELTDTKAVSPGVFRHFLVTIEAQPGDLADVFTSADKLCPEGWKCTWVTEAASASTFPTGGVLLTVEEFMALHSTRAL